MSDAQQLETTPLLGGRVHVQTHADTSTNDPVTDLPSILPVVSQLRSRETSSNHDWCPPGLPAVLRVSFMILVLTKLSLETRRPTGRAQDLWEQWEAEVHASQTLLDTKKQIIQLWTSFLDGPITSEDLMAFYWQTFPLEDGGSKRISIVDCYEKLPSEMLRHPLFTRSLTHSWMRGARTHDLTGLPLTRRMVVRFDTLATPRILHSLDVILYLAYLGLLARYALSPKTTEEEHRPMHPAISEWLVVAYSLAQVFRRWSFNTVPFVLILLALPLSFASLHDLSDIGYSMVLLAVSLHILQLHLCYPPTPMALFYHEKILPLATLLWHGVSRIFVPVTAFFFPALLVAVFLLSMSLSEALGPIISLYANPSPLEARTAFVVLLALIFSLLVCSLVMLVLVYPSLSSRPQTASEWDRYSEAIGQDARQAFARIVVTYSGPFTYTPPFNILQTIFVRIPTWLLRLTLRKDYASVQTLDQILWRATVGPFCLCLAAIFWIFDLLL